MNETVERFIHKGSRWNKSKPDPSRCVFSVTEYGRVTDWHQCHYKPVEEIQGYGFCKLHAALVKDKLGLSEAKNIRYAASFRDGEPRLAELEVVSETPKTINIKSVKPLMGSLIGLYGGSQRKDSRYVNAYEFFDTKDDAIGWLLQKGDENMRWHERELERAEKTYQGLLEEWHKE